MNIRNLNLNTLLSLEALLSECNVSKAAERCFVSQSAMSNTLNQLRKVFEDELLVRQSRGMVPTAKAAELLPQVKVILQQISDLFNDSGEFCPKTSARKFVIGMSEYNEFISLPLIVKKLQRVAPNIRLHMKEILIVDHYEEERYPDFDMILAVGFNLPPQLKYYSLHNVNAVVIAKKEHEIFKGRMTLKKYLNAKHVAIRIPYGFSQSRVDQTLIAMGHQRDVVYALPHMVPALDVVKNTDYILTNDERVVKLYGKPLGLDYRPAPFELQPVYNYLAWPKRFEQDKAHMWLRDFIIDHLSGGLL